MDKNVFKVLKGCKIAKATKVRYYLSRYRISPEIIKKALEEMKRKKILKYREEWFPMFFL